MKDTKKFKDLLAKELTVLESELATVGRKNSGKAFGWEAKQTDDDRDNADDADVADDIEQLENNAGILEDLETRLSEVKEALKKIEDGKYGICETCGEKIEEDRLLANPAAKTCKKHMNE